LLSVGRFLGAWSCWCGLVTVIIDDDTNLIPVILLCVAHGHAVKDRALVVLSVSFHSSMRFRF